MRTHFTFQRIILAFCFSIAIVFSTLAQEKNDLLERAFWATNPTLEQVKEKVALGNSPTERNLFSFDATCNAINNKASLEVITYLMSFPENHANKITHDGRTYIFWAASQGNIPVMEYLVKNGANVKHIDEKGSSAPVFAAMNGQKNTQVYDLFERNGIDLKKEQSKQGANLLLLISHSLKSIEETNYFKAKGVDLKGVDNNGYNIFAYATRGGNKSFLSELIKAGINPKNIANDGGNAFMMATQGTRSYANKVELYQFLEELGISPNTKTTSGTTPLHNIARTKDMQVVDYFSSKKIEFNQQNEEGNTALMLAASGQNNPEIFEKFLKNTDNINLKNKDGQTAMMYSMMANDSKNALLLFSKGGSVNEVDNFGNNLSFYLIKHYKNKEDYTNKLTILKAAGFKHNQLQENKNTLVHLATQQLNADLIKQLIEDEKIAINAVNNEGMTALHIAASMDKDGAILKLLLSLGADKSIQTEFGESVYELATENELLQKNKIDLEFLK